ncbi:cytochrome c oxidase assembly protein [Streptomyces sp. NPDC005423]|uniref:cytochrome c oxidase assembly protein n=1 Tax=Streptomyces sp. NPDC005423 TaxID=3155343 RepID=UPI0033ACAF71
MPMHMPVPVPVPVPTPMSMSMPMSMPMSGDPASAVPQWFAAALAAAGVALYLSAAWRLRRRGDAWPRVRELSFAAGGGALAAVALAPLPGGEFTAHMTQHVVVGMAAPLLLVLGRPVTLVLRVLPAGPPRRGLLALVRSAPAGLLVFPPVAALIDIGGLWLLYGTRLFAGTHDRPWPHAAVHAHVLAAGLLFAFAVCRLDPLRRRYGLPLRAATLVAAGAAHSVLAKTLYGASPPGTAFTAHDLARGAEVMYYGGDLAEIALAAVLAWQWYAAAGRTLAHARRRATVVPVPSAPVAGRRGPDRAGVRW